ncbi:MAG TPA: hypothetical protein VFN23_03895 [Ktedonobacteraceae bacterium]|nr:hypothetical protein [Ktedonobacteraceae bacterium]
MTNQQQQEHILWGPAVPDGVLIGHALAGDQVAFECLRKLRKESTCIVRYGLLLSCGDRS